MAFEPQFARQARRGVQRHRLGGVFDQIHEHDLQLLGVATDGRYDSGKFRAYSRVCSPEEVV